MVDKKLIGVYGRCSTEKQDMITQKTILNKFVESYKLNNDVAVVKEYFDEGFSGTNQGRPGLNKLMSDVDNGYINTVIIMKLDRLARSLKDLVMITENFKQKGCDLVIIKDNIDTSTMAGQLLFNIYASFIQFERDTIVERMRMGTERARLEGSKSGKPCHRPKLDLDMNQIRRMKKEGISYNAIAEYFKVSRQTIKNRLTKEGF